MNYLLIGVGGSLLLLSGVIALGGVVATARSDERERRNQALDLLLFGRTIPTLNTIEPTSLGVFRSTIAESESAGASESGRPQYVARTVDGALETALQNEPFVLLHGKSKAGKSRTAFEVASRIYGNSPLLVPRNGRALADLLSSGSDLELATGPVVLWLDDLQNYLDEGVIARVDIDRFRQETSQRVVVIATMLKDERARLRAVSGDIGRQARDLLDAAAHVELLSTPGSWDEGEAAEFYPQLSFDKLGIGGTLTATDELIGKYQNERDSPLGVAIVRACIDWRRAGLVRPTSEKILRDLVPLYLSGARITDEAFADALLWANIPVSSSARLISFVEVEGEAGYRAFDAIIEYDDPRPIPEGMWLMLLDRLDSREVVDLGVAAWFRGSPTVAERAFVQAATAGDVEAPFYLGSLLHSRGEVEEAEVWWSRADAVGHLVATFNLGVLLAERGETEQAEGLFRKAAENGDSGAMLNLAVLLDKRGEVELAESWSRKGAESGEPIPMFLFAARLEERGEIEDAKAWYRKAAETGHPDALYNFGAFLKEQGELDEAERWYREGARSGHAGSLNSLGLLLKGRNDIEEAKNCLRTAAESGHMRAMFNLAVLLEEGGEIEEAESWYRMSAREGFPGALDAVGRLLNQRGDFDEGHAWSRDAALAYAIEAGLIPPDRAPWIKRPEQLVYRRVLDPGQDK